MSNRLAAEASPYLRQHADNPVDWYPWGEEALARARAENRPILLSIGYAACHWCHVMAQESFADADTAALMNALFINVKVDREERPDLDHLYQRTHQLLTGRPGGWPLTVFLSPDQTPFFSGTYFPREARYGLIGFAALMRRIDEAFRTQREALAAQNAALRAQLAETDRDDGRQGDRRADPAAAAAAAVATLLAQVDTRRGGLGDAPKFPHPVEMSFLLRHGGEAGRAAALAALRAMALGGLQDHAGGGFFRYCVDAGWQIPHFEKMLYDNALLLGLFAEAAGAGDAATGPAGQSPASDPLWRQAAAGIADWLTREMLADGEALFCASLDADADHEEGAFYLWTPQAAREVLGAAAMRIAAPAFGLDRPPNFEGRAWHLCRPQDDATLALQLALPPAELAAELAHCRTLLLAARGERVRPGRDDKGLTGWNALTCTALLKAGRAFARADWVKLAQTVIDTLRECILPDGRLAAIRQHGEVRLAAYLDDHAFLLEALLESLATDWRDADLELARQIAGAIVDRFQDADGVLWMTAHDHETLIARPRDIHDQAQPAGAAIAIGTLAQLAAIDGEPRWQAAAERALAAHAGEAAGYPAAACSYWRAALSLAAGVPLCKVRAPRARHAGWQAALAGRLPAGMLLVCLPGDDPAALATLCLGRRCLPPAATPAELLAQLATLPAAPR
jgi:uncharacterized protein YyaL (SSP411 family)